MSVRVLFRVAAGPRVGFGHLMRSRSIAAALDIVPLVSLRGTPDSAAIARSLGVRVAGSLTAALRQARPTLLVVDDPCAKAATRAIGAARRLGIATASIHDLGTARCDADLTIDGSIAPGPMSLAGPRFAILDPQIRHLAAARGVRSRRRPLLVIAFGGGPRRQLARAVARAIGRRRPDVDIRVAWGFGAHRTFAGHKRIAVIEPARAFRKVLAAATVAVVAGGVTLYEACALGVPAVGVSIVRAQRRSVAGLARRGAVIDGGEADPVHHAAARIAGLVVGLLETPSTRSRLARTGRRLVDGRGAARVAARLRSLGARPDEREAA